MPLFMHFANIDGVTISFDVLISFCGFWTKFPYPNFVCISVVPTCSSCNFWCRGWTKTNLGNDFTFSLRLECISEIFHFPIQYFGWMRSETTLKIEFNALENDVGSARYKLRSSSRLCMRHFLNKICPQIVDNSQLWCTKDARYSKERNRKFSNNSIVCFYIMLPKT